MPVALLMMRPVVFDDPSLESAWRPENYSGKFFGPTRLREALYKSRNLVSIRLLRAIGIDYTVDYVTRFGFDPERLPRNLSLSLGTPTVKTDRGRDRLRGTRQRRFQGFALPR